MSAEQREAATSDSNGITAADAEGEPGSAESVRRVRYGERVYVC